MKPCIRCGEVKPLNEFYAHPMMGDGHLNKCRVCCKMDARRRHYAKSLDPAWREAERLRSNEKRKRYRHLWATDAKVPRGAHCAAKRAFPRPPTGMERHHWSYRHEHWIDVLFVTVEVHRALHHWMRYDPEARCFRTPHGHLLDTKAKHVRWMLAVLNDRSKYMTAA